MFSARHQVVNVPVQHAHKAGIKRSKTTSDSHVKSVLDSEPESDGKVREQRVYAISEAHISNRMTANDSSSEMRSDTWLMVVHRQRD